MNRLQYETSPYLLQHAGNPVDWYAWKPEAFERAQAEQKPILVSIGYSTCHWCHVMERESFEDKATAAFMNEHFVNIKVDREERPDVDQIYMDACQALSGQGGWPLNCFLLPDKRPFYAGTYYPPRPAHNRPSWRQLLERIVRVYRDEPGKVEQQADQLVEMIGRSDTVFLQEGLLPEEAQAGQFTREDQGRIFRHLEEGFDKTHGGFGGAPKFPQAMALHYLLEYGQQYGDEAAVRHVKHSLGKMIRGGIYDQLGGGFARYATDRAWLVPHFEKMLYDNALLVRLLADAHRAAPDPLYRRTIEETLGFIAREMTGPEGGFYAALDADSEGEEGKYYLWDADELETVLGPQAELFGAFYGVRDEGNWEGRNILWRPRPISEFAETRGLEEAPLRHHFAEQRRRLLEVREQRIRPGLDDKVLLGWNALQCTAYAHAFAALGHAEYREAASRNIDFLLDRFRSGHEPGFHHTYKAGSAQYDAFLDDLAFLIEALLAVYRITFDKAYLDTAQAVARQVQTHYYDPESGLFFYTAASQSDLILRKKELYDSAVPSGNSTMVHNLLQLAAFFDDAAARDRALRMLATMKASIEKYPSSFANWARACLHVAEPGYEIAVVGADARAVAARVNAYYLPNTIVMAAAEGDEHYPLLAGKSGGSPSKIYVCRQYACQQPVTSLKEMEKIVNR